MRKGQEEGTIRKQGSDARIDLRPDTGVGSSLDHFSGHNEREHAYRMADAPTEDFDAAVQEAKAEGNLSRANVVRKVKGEEPKQKRSEWHHKKRHIDSNRIIERLSIELDAVTSCLDLIDPSALDPETKQECTESINQSISTIKRGMTKW